MPSSAGRAGWEYRGESPMPDARNLIRTSGLTLVAAGVLYLPLPFIPSWTRIEDIGTPIWQLVYHLATLHHFVLLFGLFGLFAAQAHRAGGLGLIAFIVTSLGNALVGGIGIVQLTILPVLAANPDVQAMLICTPFYAPATASAEGFIASACAAWNFDVLGSWAGASWLLLMVGSIALGVAIARAGVLPRWPGLLLVLGWLYVAGGLLFPLPDAIANLGLAVIGAGYAACGWFVWTAGRRMGPAAAA